MKRSKLDENENKYDVDNKYSEKYEAQKAKAVRHIILIRHGQYHTEGEIDSKRMLTELGKHNNML